MHKINQEIEIIKRDQTEIIKVINILTGFNRRFEHKERIYRLETVATKGVESKGQKIGRKKPS